MNSIKVYGSFLKESFEETKNNFRVYLGCYIAFILVNFISSIPWVGMGHEDNSFYSIIANIFVGLFSLVIVVSVIMIEKSRINLKEKEKLFYAAPTYLIYTLYYSIVLMIGLACFIVPGIIVAVGFGMVPVAAVLIDSDNVNYFKVSWRMAKKDAVMMTIFTLASILAELVGVALDLIPDWRVKLGVNLMYSFIDALVLIVITKASVKVFYHLQSRLNEAR
ncbi:MAG: hypothetical protein H7177_12225 [Rhizobacter sp.]|nr:hypothetical protein [Bacteriovorax sp.]